jgi:hypothetical protein
MMGGGRTVLELICLHLWRSTASLPHWYMAQASSVIESVRGLWGQPDIVLSSYTCVNGLDLKRETYSSPKIT